MTKWVYSFGSGEAEGRAEVRALLGGKGAKLAGVSNLGLRVAWVSTSPTGVSPYFYRHRETYPGDLNPAVESALGRLSELTGCRFGDDKRPLLVSVRSGARASMPGMMDTVLNLGLN